MSVESEGCQETGVAVCVRCGREVVTYFGTSGNLADIPMPTYLYEPHFNTYGVICPKSNKPVNPWLDNVDYADAK